MLFSSYFGVQKEEGESWFDPILDFDVHLFIDPFRIFAAPLPPFESGHAKIIEFFNKAFQLAAEAGGRGGLRHRLLVDMLQFPEAAELCLGYTEASTLGSGSGRGLSEVVAAGIYESIARGIVQVHHFEEIGLLHEGIGCDRISDITANILKPELVGYTQRVCAAHGIPVEAATLRNGRFDLGFLRWESARVSLPENPFSGRPILLVPESFLRPLPTITAEDFWDYLWNNEGQRLRDQFGYHVKSRVRKRDIIRIARENHFLIRQYVQHVEGRAAPVPYDLQQDPGGLYQWESAAGRFVSRFPLALPPPGSMQEFNSLVTSIVEQFRHFVEQEGGRELLWNDPPGGPKPEQAAQLLFQGVVKHYCKANNIDLSREPETGRGPVDFKFSNGFAQRTLLEVKLARNTRFWHGIRRQVPTYLQASQIQHGIVVIIVLEEKELQRLGQLQELVQTVGQKIGASIRPVIVNALRQRPSASRA
jgi:hypothetical protein